MKGSDEAAKTGTPPLRGSRAKARAVVKLVVLAAIVAGLCVHTGFGTYSSAGIGFVASVCPLGALEGLFGAWAFVPRLLIGLAAMLLVILIFGRAFCSWVCPVPPVAAFFKTKRRRQREAQLREEAGRTVLERYRRASRSSGESGRPEGCPDAESGEEAQSPAAAKARLDSRHIVLCGALGSAAVFGFPVFCLICPIGLTCATLVLLVRLLGIGELSWGLAVFPIVLVLEVAVLKDYCAKICPVAALMSLVARANRTFRPKADVQACLRDGEHGSCHACASACPEHIDPRAGLGDAALNECTRCGRCADACPEKAISFPLLPKK